MALSVSFLKRLVGRGPLGYLPLAQQFTAVDPHLIELEQPVDRLGVPFPGKIQQPSPLIEFFLFRM
jgi:hypothetical protein